MTASGTTSIYTNLKKTSDAKALATRVKCQRIGITQTKQEKKLHGINNKRKGKRSIKKQNKNGNRPRKLEPSLKTRSTSKSNSIRAHTQENIILTNPEKFNHTKLSENYSRKFKHTKLGETKTTKNEF